MSEQISHTNETGLPDLSPAAIAMVAEAERIMLANFPPNTCDLALYTGVSETFAFLIAGNLDLDLRSIVIDGKDFTPTADIVGLYDFHTYVDYHAEVLSQMPTPPMAEGSCSPYGVAIALSKLYVHFPSGYREAITVILKCRLFS